MSKVHEPERDPLDALGQVVDGLGRPVGDVGAMPRADLIGPLRDRASEAANLDGHGEVGEVAADRCDPCVGEVGVGVVVDLADHLLRVPREPHLLARVASTQQSKHTLMLIIGEPFPRDRQPTPGSVERVVASAPVPARLVLNATSALVECPVFLSSRALMSY